MSVAGYNTTVKRGGTSTAMVDEPMTNTAGDTWQINDTAKRFWDRTVVPTFEDNAVPINAADIQSIDYLFGTVTFTASKTGPITVATGNYIPTLAIAGASSYQLNQARVALDDSSFDKTNVNGGIRTRITGLTDINVVINRWEELDQTFFDAINNRTSVVIEIRPGGSGDVFRAWMATETEVHSGEVSDQEQQELTFQMNANSEAAFGWGAP